MNSGPWNYSQAIRHQKSHMASLSRPFSGFEWMVAMRYLRPRRKEAFVSVISILSLLGIALGVASGFLDPSRAFAWIEDDSRRPRLARLPGSEVVVD